MPEQSDQASSVGKRVYSPPVLRIYGTVNTLTQGVGGSRAAYYDGNGTGSGSSDRSLKENIVRIGTHPLGMGLYLFDYKPEYRDMAGYGRRFGVMADEVEAVLPAAVGLHPTGHKVVHYSMLGMSFPSILH